MNFFSLRLTSLPLRAVGSLLILCGLDAAAQSSDVPIYSESPGDEAEKDLIIEKVNALPESEKLLTMEKIKEQMERKSCELELSEPSMAKLESRDLWKHARKGHLRVGWLYKCGKCNDWHLNFGGGFAITSDTVVTCGHVVMNESAVEGVLIVVDEENKVLPVTEVLAGDVLTDTAILRVAGAKFEPLSLTLDVVPGDRAFCFSDPLGRRGFYSDGIVNRFTRRPFVRDSTVVKDEFPKEGAEVAEDPVWVQVSTDWAPGSSGSAVLDANGNVMGFVSGISAASDTSASSPTGMGTLMVLHDAVAAQNILRLIKKKP